MYNDHISGCIPRQILALSNDTKYTTSNSMRQSPSWEANSSAATQEIPRILWNPQFIHSFHNNPPPVHILRQISPIHAPVNLFLVGPF